MPVSVFSDERVIVCTPATLFRMKGHRRPGRSVSSAGDRSSRGGDTFEGGCAGVEVAFG
jgi:hypothetical protein